MRPDLISIISSSDYLNDVTHCPPTLKARPAAAGRSLMGVHQRASAAATLAFATARQSLFPAALVDGSSSGAYWLDGRGEGEGDGARPANATMAAAVAAAKPGDGPVPRVLIDYGGLLLLISLGAAAVLTVLFVFALRHSPWALVLLACFLQVGAPLASAVIASNAGNSSLALLLLLASCLIAISLYVGRDSLALVARLLGLAAVALRDNPAILLLVMLLKLALAGATALLLLAAAVVGIAGDVVANPLRGGNPRCATPAGTPVTCCAWAPSAALPAYLPVASAALTWTLALLFELKVYVISGCVAQWYFSPAGHVNGGGGSWLSGGGGVAGGYSSGRALLASLSHALGPSFGSLCAASGVLGATVYLRAVVNRLAFRSRPAHAMQYGTGAIVASPCCWGCQGLVATLLGCCCYCLVTILEQLTKFATVQMAMSGMGFYRASQEVVALCRRNFIDAYNMWWYLPWVLFCGAGAFAAAWGYTAYWLSVRWGHLFFITHHAPLNAAAAAVLGVLAAATAALVLSFVCSVLVNLSDALFVCYVLDRDSSAVTWVELHVVCQQLPCCAAARAAFEGDAAHQVHAHDASYYYAPPPPPPLYSGGGAPYSPYYQPPALHHGGAAVGAAAMPGSAHPQLGLPLGYSQQRPQYSQGHAHQSSASGGGFWGFGWLRSPGGSNGMPVGLPRDQRPQYPPPAVLSPPYSDQRFPLRPPLGPPPPPYFGPVPPS